jgi:3-deoxy-D-manno-octulosonate cytidylyltransferase
MQKINLLDCTLRDGGYINNWQFSKRIGNKIIKSLIDSKVDIIEYGYISSKSILNNESTLFNNIEDLIQYTEETASLTNKTMNVIMVNQGDIDITKLPQNHKFIDGVRLAFHKQNLEEALFEAEIIISKGYKLFFQPMVTKSYSDEEFIYLMKKANELSPYAFYIVDSFGSMDKKEFIRYLMLAEYELNKSIILGFHGHNNMQFVLANAINMIENITDREIIIDSSIFGMGRGAGNLNTEIIMDYLNKYYDKEYDTKPLLTVMDDYIENIYKTNPWGFTPSQYFSAKYDCHPNYAMFLTNKKKLSISDIHNILGSIDEVHKKSFDTAYIEDLYIKYNTKNKSNVISLEPLVNNEILLVGSGLSIQKYKSEILTKIQESKVISISLNFINDDFNTTYYIFTNQKRYDEYIDKVDKKKLIVTSNITLHKEHDDCFILDYNKLLNKTIDNFDNILSMTLAFLADNKISKVYLAGIDGYKTDSQNYIDEQTGLTDKYKMIEENKKLSGLLKYFSNIFSIEFITPSLFKDDISLKILGVIPARYKSSRFEGKPLCKINNIPMLKRTYIQAKKSKLLTDLIVATDDIRIKDFCDEENIPVIMTSESCLTGTDRIAEVSSKLHYDLYVNIQGDEPVIDPLAIDEIVSEYHQYKDDYIAYNLYKFIDDSDEINSNTIIKVIVNEKDELMYMSRLNVPFNKSIKQAKYKKQVCVYGFTKYALDIFSSKEKTLNEQFEDIEILRFIDMGYKVKMRETKLDSISVDVPNDIYKVEKFLNENGIC